MFYISFKELDEINLDGLEVDNDFILGTQGVFKNKLEKRRGLKAYKIE